jgi:capsular polysaccharide biosynthesis protein
MIFGSYPLELQNEAEHDILDLAEDSSLYNRLVNGPAQQGSPKIKIYKDVSFWHTQSIAATREKVIEATFIDADRIARIQRLKVLRRYPVLPVPFHCTSIDYIFTGGNFYHYLVDSLPRLWGLGHPGLQGERQPIVFLNSNTPPAYQEFSEFMFPKVRFVKLPRYFRIRPKSYVHLPYLSKDRVDYAPEDSQTSGGFLPNEYLDYVRDKIGSAPFSSRYPVIERLYIKRGSTGVRRVVNELEVEEKLRGMGFVCLDLKDLTLMEQARLFLNAKVIVGAHGAGFANLLYCHGPKTVVFEIYPSKNEARHYYTLYGKVSKLNYHAIYLDEKHISSNFKIPEDVIMGIGLSIRDGRR